MVIKMKTDKYENLKSILEYLPTDIVSVLRSLSADAIDNLCEIRVKASCPVVLIFTNGRFFITDSGRLTSFFASDLVKTDSESVKEIFNRMCRYSVYSLTDNISEGFITLHNGCRVGVYGTAVTSEGKINSVRNIKGMNIRLSGRFDGVSEKIANLYKRKAVNTLICGPPSSGKTTLLKDLCRSLSDDFNYKISAVDERGELSGEYLGYNTDVLSEYPKAAGIQIAVRTLSPDIIICDEVGGADEVKSIIEGLNSGVCFIMSVHSGSKAELVKKEQFLLLQRSCYLDYVAFVRGKSEIAEICSVKEICNEDCGVDFSGNNACTYRTTHSLFI